MNTARTRFAWRAHAPVLAGFALLALLPLGASDTLLSTLTLVLVAAYFGQAWNLMMGYVGQLSLGHGLYAGLGASGPKAPAPKAPAPKPVPPGRRRAAPPSQRLQAGTR